MDSVVERILARRPEERLINDFAVLQATLRKLATGVAYLSLTWSTVVLLGSFVAVLKRIDFWFLTVITTSFALNLADLCEYKIGFLLAGGKMYIGLRDYLARGLSFHDRVVCFVVVIACFLADACLGLFILLLSAALQILGLAPLAAIVLSVHRLQTVHYHFSHHNNAPKLTASIRIFYSLALAQNALFCLWSLFLLTENRRASAVSRQCGFGEDWGTSLVRRYLGETTSICAAAQQGAVPRGRNLITFAVGLLGSESLDDRRCAVRALDTFVGSKVPVEPTLLPCRGALENLLELLEVAGDGETRKRTARIVVALAGDLRYIDQFPKALDHVASLFQLPPSTATCCSSSSFSMPLSSSAAATATRTKTMTSPWLYWGILSLLNVFDKGEKQDQLEDHDVVPYGEPKLLISQGLLIVERLALHKENCAHICNNHVLLSKITAPLNSHAFPDAEYDGDWINILGRSLRIVVMLMRAPGEASQALRDAIGSNTRYVSNLTRVLEDAKFGAVLKTAAIDILAELASSDTSPMCLDIKMFISRLRGIFLAQVDNSSTTTTIEQEEQRRQQATRLRQKSGEALAQMLSVRNPIMDMFIQITTSSSEQVPTAELRHVVGQLTDILIQSKGSRTSAARILECLCSHFSTKHRQLLPRQDMIEMLGKVLQVIPCIRREETNKGMVVGGANNNLAVQNDDENPCSQDQTTGIQLSTEQEEEQQQEEKAFVVSLLTLTVVICDRMVDPHDFTWATLHDTVFDDLAKKLKDIIETSTNSDSTVEVKLSCQLVVSMVQLKPSSVKVFIDHGFEDVLSKSYKSLCDLDNCLMLFGDADHCLQVKTTDKPLFSLVKQALELFDKAKEPANEPP